MHVVDGWYDGRRGRSAQVAHVSMGVEHRKKVSLTRVREAEEPNLILVLSTVTPEGAEIVAEPATLIVRLPPTFWDWSPLTCTDRDPALASNTI
jgi:hypothetical protein